MSHSAFYRMSGVALLAGGLLATAATALHPNNIIDPRNVPVHVALYTGVMVILLGLPGLAARMSLRAPVLGLAGSVLLFLGLAYEDPLHSVLAFTVIPTLIANPATRPLLDGRSLRPGMLLFFQMAALPAIAAGLILIGISIWRTNVLPRWLAVPPLATVLLFPLSFVVPPLRPVGPSLLYLSVAALGWALGTVRPTTPEPTLQ